MTVMPVSLESLPESMVSLPLNAFSSTRFSTGPLLALSFKPSLTPSGLKRNLSTNCLTTITTKARGIGYHRSPNLAKSLGSITDPSFTTRVSSKLSQVTLGGSQMSGFQNHLAAPRIIPAIPSLSITLFEEGQHLTTILTLEAEEKM